MDGEEFVRKVAEAPALAVDKTLEVTGNIIPAKQMIHTAQKYWGSLGPGLTTGAADDDPSGIATYSQAGAQFQYSLIWLSLFSIPGMIAVQEMCARIGYVTGMGLSAVMKKYYSKWLLYTCVFLLFFANTLNIGADIAGMSAALKLIVDIPVFWLAIIVTLLSIILEVSLSYKVYAKYLKFLTLALLSYVITAFLIKMDWGTVLSHTVIPRFSFNQEAFYMITAILGTTISPYLFYWQPSQEIEQEKDNGVKQADLTITTNAEIKAMRKDVVTGMIFSNVAMFFIIAVTGTVLYSQGYSISTAADAAEALRPLAGDFAYILFMIGIIGVGLLGLPVLAGSASYAISEAFRMKEGLNNKLKNAYGFYGVIIIAMILGLAINFLGLDPIKTLIFSAVINGLVAPILLVCILLISNNKTIMGEWRNGKWSNISGWIITALMIVAGVATIVGLF